MVETFDFEQNASIEQERQSEANRRLAAKTQVETEADHFTGMNAETGAERSSEAGAGMDRDGSKKRKGPNRPSI